MKLINPKKLGAKHLVALPPMQVPLRCIVPNENKKPWPLNPWSNLNVWNSINGGRRPQWRGNFNEMFVVTNIEYMYEWKGGSHDAWRLTIMHDAKYNQYLFEQYLWASHEIYAPSGTRMNLWTEYWTYAALK